MHKDCPSCQVRRTTLAVSIAALLSLPAMSGPALAQDAAATRLLVDQGKYWQANRRGDLAAQAWTKLLAIDPKQPDALYGMGIVEVDRGHANLAQDYLNRLKQVAPNYAGVATLAQRLGQPAPQDVNLNAARQLAQQGKANQAVERYRQATDGKPMTPEVALEYYQTLGGTSNGWDEARRGLEKLAHDNPGNARIALALGQHLSYREASRRDGIRLLSQLASDADVGAAARASWRQALIWLGARSSDTPLYQAYLKAVPDDPPVKARLDAIAQQEQNARAAQAANAAADARGRAVAAGFDALQKGDLDLATQRFTAVLADHPNDADALGGMGVLRLKQEKFAEARDLLERASRGGNPGRWRSALTSATYWALVNEANAARQSGGPDGLRRARELLERAIKVDPNEITAQNALGDVLLAGGDGAAAEAAYRMALRRQSDNPDAIRGLVGALAQQNKTEEALRFASQLSEQERQRIGGLGALRAQQQQTQARAAEQRGDLAGARTDLENALLNDPDSPWIRLDLARVYRKQGALTNARSVMDGLLATHPDMPDALYASALLYGELGDWNRVLEMLGRIAPQNRTRDMVTLQRRAWVHANVDRANAMIDQGQRAAAHALLEQVAPVAGTDTELMGAVASAFAQSGDDTRALGMMRQLMSQSAVPDAGLRIQYAGILLKTQQDAELAGVLRQIQSMQLTETQRADLDKLQLALVIRQADALREQGRLVDAYNVIAPALAANPDIPDLQAVLARMYTAVGEYDHALRLYVSAHKAQPDDLEITLAAASTAALARNFDFAEDAIQSALKQAPNSPRVLAAAGRIYRAEGSNSRAASYFRQALAAENGPPSGANGTLDLRLVGQQSANPTVQYAADRLPANPFAGKAIVNPARPSTPVNGAVASGAPMPGQFSGTGQPSGGPAPAAYPYPTQAYPSQPSPSQTMPYIAPNAAPAPYIQQAPAYQSAPAPRAYYGPSSALPAAASMAAQRDISAGSAGADYAGGGDSAPGYGAYAQPQPSQGGYGQPYAPQGYAANGNPPNGYQANGYQANGYQANGYQANGYGPAGYPNPAYQQGAYPAQAYPQNGYPPQAQASYSRYAQQPSGSYPGAYQQATYGGPSGQQNPYAPQQPNGYQPNGYAPNGYAANGYAPNGYAPNGYAPNGYAPNGYAPNGYASNGYAPNGYAPNGYAPNGYAPNGYAAGPQAQAPWPQEPLPEYAGGAPDPCLSSGADGGTTAAAGGGRGATALAQCRDVPARKTVVRRRSASVPRTAAQRQYAQQPLPAPQQYAPYAGSAPYAPYPPYGQNAAYAAAPAPAYAQAGEAAPVWSGNTTGTAVPSGPLTIQQELDQINQQTASSVAAGVSIHSRDGEQGLSSLTDIEAPLEGRVRAGDGHIVVRATPVLLDSGTPSSSYDVVSRFGSGPAAAYAQRVTNGASVGSQNAAGVGISGGYETERLRVDVGSTPVGFQKTNIVGGLNYRGSIGDQTTYAIDASRRAVTDSLLSYAGVKDSRTGLQWGGVTASGARLDLTWDDGTNGIYGYGSYSYLQGTGVASNTRGEGGGGIYTRLIKDTDRTLTAGVNVTVFGYDKNLRYFTYGQGGYFSPQQYVSLSLPVTWNQRSGKLAYQVKGAIGVQHFREKDSDYFPTDSTMQANAQAAQTAAAAAGYTSNSSAVYPGQTKTGLGYNLQASAEYQLSPQMFFGGIAGIDNARDYSQWFGGVYLRYAFDRMTGPVALPPVPLHSPYLPN